MNYKDRDNILLVICGAMAVVAFAFGFRYFFTSKWSLDAFGANLVFIIIFVIGLAFFTSYLELIQNIRSHFFKKKKKSKNEEVESKSPQETNSDINSIREKHQQEEIARKEKLLTRALEYTKTTFAPYANDENINRLCSYIADYYNGINLNQDAQSVNVKDLNNGDLFHYGWNIWNHFKSVKHNKQEEIAYFLKVVFARNLKDVDKDTIRKKLTFGEGEFLIGINKLIDSDINMKSSRWKTPI